MRWRVVLTLGALAALAVVPAAQAAWTTPGLRDATGQHQGSALQTTISADGRFVAFTALGGQLLPQASPAGTYRSGGVYRTDLETDEVAVVMPGVVHDITSDQETGAGGGGSPSLSGDGRFVAFTTTDALVAGDTNGADDVYVRDMTVAADAPGAYVLASAQDGTDAAIPWDGEDAGRRGATLAQAGGALSDDGRRVVFTAGASGDVGHDDTVPAGAVLARDLDTRHTLVVSVRHGDQLPLGGAAGAAVISGDGSTVAWVGVDAAAQAPFDADENADPSLPWILWRRIADGAAAGTERVAATGTLGPFDLGSEIQADPFPAAPSLSRDGATVTFVTSYGLQAVEQLNGFGLPDLFVAAMEPGHAAAMSIDELTREDGILNSAISEDGQSIVFSTARTRFRLSDPAQVGTPASSGLDVETYVLDRRTRTFELITRAPDGSKALGNASDTDPPKLSADGRRVAFTSAASNLVLGDINGGPDAFTADRLPDADVSAPAAQDIPAQLPAPQPPVAYVLRVRAVPQRDGSLRINALIPSPGRLSARLATGVRRTVAAASTQQPGPNVSIVLRAARRWRGAIRGHGLLVSLRVRFAASGAPFAGRRPLARTLTARLRVRAAAAPTRRVSR